VETTLNESRLSHNSSEIWAFKRGLAKEGKRYCGICNSVKLLDSFHVSTKNRYEYTCKVCRSKQAKEKRVLEGKLVKLKLARIENREAKELLEKEKERRCCQSCKIEKPLSSFNKSSRHSLGRAMSCRKCAADVRKRKGALTREQKDKRNSRIREQRASEPDKWRAKSYGTQEEYLAVKERHEARAFRKANELRRCCTCGEVKYLSNFYKANARCIACISEHSEKEAKDLTDSYVKSLLRCKKITPHPQIVEVQREILKIKRQLKSSVL
jgi:hypothetical protein